jgi:hypothetical protein
MCAHSGYVIATLPNFINAGYASVQLNSVSAQNNQEIYYLPCPYASSAVSFDYNTPLSNGWTATKPAQTCYVAIKHLDLLCDTDGAQSTKLNFVATHSDGSLLPPGTKLTTTVTVTAPDDDNLTNNTGAAVTNIPSLDLFATIAGSVE